MPLRVCRSLLFHQRAACFKWQCPAQWSKSYVTGRTMKTLQSQTQTQSHNCSISERLKLNSSYSRFVICRDFQEKEEHEFQLMEMPQVCSRDITGLVNNWISFLKIILKYDQDFRPNLFLVGAHQAIVRVSRYISEGDFKALQGLMAPKAIREVKRNFEKLSSDQKDLISVNGAEVLHHFIFDVRLKESPLLKEPWTKGWDEIIPATTAEIMVVLEGSHLSGSKNDVERVTEYPVKFFCNYRFERSFEAEGWHSSWVITQVNHFIPPVDY